MPAAKEEAKRPCPRARQCVGLRVRGAECASGKNSSPPMQTLQRKRCQTRARSRKKGCAYGARVSGATIFTYVNGNPLGYTDPQGLNPLAGAWAGAGAGSAFGPVGTVVGGLIGAGAGAWIGWNIVGPMLIKPPDNAYDPNGPKAPGKPGEADGFKDPKGGDNWVPNPNPGKGGAGYGWQDANGDVWCPTGQGGTAHGGPHWDVQTPGGGYRNVRPQKK